MTSDVVVIGDANVDLVLRGDVVPRFGQAEQLLEAADLTLGGSGAIVACGLARLGLDVRLVAAVGNDTFGEVALDLLRERGVGVEAVTVRGDVGTGVTVVLSGPERAILTHPGAIATLAAGDLPPGLVEDTRHVHAASVYLTTRMRPDLPGLLRVARAAGASTSLDTNDDPARTWAGLADLVGAVDVVLPNDAEALRWAASWGEPAQDWTAAARRIAARGPDVVVKAGPEGGAVVSGDRVVRQPAPSLTPVDTTGAGDGFDAGWIAARLAGHPLPTALGWAVAAGSAATRAAGGIAAQAFPAMLEAAVDSLPPATAGVITA